MKKSVMGAVISALICVGCAVGLYKTYEPIFLIWGCLSVMVLIGCISDMFEGAA